MDSWLLERGEFKAGFRKRGETAFGGEVEKCAPGRGRLRDANSAIPNNRCHFPSTYYTPDTTLSAF